MTALKVVLFVALLVVALVFAYYNMEPVKIKLLGRAVETPLFLVILVSLFGGFLTTYIFSELRVLYLRRRKGKTEKALRDLWTGYPEKAEKGLKSLIGDEEFVPLYLESLKEQGKVLEVKMERYKLGIAEVFLAEKVLREDPKRAKELLEKALGKNWGNLRAKRLLRSLYFIEGEHKKAVDLQRSLVEQVKGKQKEEELKVLSSMLSWSLKEEALEEIEKLPKTVSSLALIVSSSDEDKGAKVFQSAVEKGMGNELLALLWERKALTPKILEVTWSKKEKFDPLLLATLCKEMGMREKLEELKDLLSEPIDEEQGCKDLWVCGECGMRYGSYTPVCEVCLSWNRLKIKGGRGNVNRLIEGSGSV